LRPPSLKNPSSLTLGEHEWLISAQQSNPACDFWRVVKRVIYSRRI
jgi:hypothetical protein